MKSIWSILLLGLISLWPAAGFCQTTLVVSQTTPACNTGTPVYTTIQGAVNAATGTDVTIIVCDGTYDEQVVVSGKTNLTIASENPQGAVVEPAAGAFGPVIHVVNSTGVTIDGFEVTGGNHFRAGCNSSDNRIAGIRFDNSTGTVSDNLVTGIKHTDSAYFGCQEGLAIWVASSDTGHSNVTIDSNTLTDFQKAGIVVNGSRSSAVLTKNSVEGAGATLQTAQDGIQFGWGASGEARGNLIRNNWYSGSGWSATGILLFNVDSKNVKHSLNKYSGNQKNLAMVTSQACPNMYGGVYQDYSLCSL